MRSRPAPNEVDTNRTIQLGVGSNIEILRDKDSLKQVLLIALDNALKHSTGDIHVTADRKGRIVEVRVQDFGEGISPEKLDHVFDRFYRRNDTTTIPGFGLGLSIAKTLVMGMGGEIVMQSQQGTRSTVIIQLPLSR